MQKGLKILTFRNVMLLGLAIAFLVSLMEVMRGRQLNFLIFQNATLDFWNGISPYGEQWMRHGLDWFLYGPLFNLLFAPFAYLPGWLGPFAWNLFNYGMYALAIYTLPRFDDRTKARILLYTLPLLAVTQLSFQYNVAIAYIYLFAFTLLERGRAPWAILLILVSALTKVYGLFELSILLFYPKFWRNMGWTALIAAGLLLLPAVKIPLGELPAYYGSWFDALGSHKDTRVFETFFNIRVLWGEHLPACIHYVQTGVLALLAVLVVANRKRFGDFAFRIQSVGILMGWMILFSNAAEKHTYVIALLGYLLWYWTQADRRLFDRVLYWVNLAVLVLMPIDLICPPAVMHFFFDTLDLNQWLFLLTWCVMVWQTYVKRWPVQTL